MITIFRDGHHPENGFVTANLEFAVLKQLVTSFPDNSKYIEQHGVSAFGV